MKNHENQQIAASLPFLECYSKDGDSLFYCIVTGDKIWEKHINYEIKLKFIEQGHTRS